MTPTLKKFALAGAVSLIVVPLMLAAQSGSFQTQTQTAVSTGTYCPQLLENLQRGTRGGQVMELQHFLSAFYGIDSGTIMTGYFGPITQSYVIRFQQEHGLPAFGFVGPMTRPVIATACGASNEGPNLNIITPTGGETLCKNVPVEIKWNASQDIDIVYFELTTPVATYQIAQVRADYTGGVTTPGRGAYLWDIGAFERSSGQSLPTSDTYKIVLSSTYGGYGTVASSGYVAIKDCSGDQSTSTLSASPTSGQAPLAVRLTASGLGSVGEDYSVDFGDGTSGRGSCSITSAGFCPQDPSTLYFNHTYTAAGTHTAKLHNNLMACAPADCNVVGTVTITVYSQTPTDTTTSMFSASPTSGQAPLSVSFSGSHLNKNSIYYISYGDGANGQMTLNAPPCAYGVDCSNLYTGQSSHTYTSAGVYTVQFSRAPVCSGYMMCPAYLQLVGTVTITVAGNSQSVSTGSVSPTQGPVGATVTVTNGQPQQATLTASPTSGSAPLAVSFSYEIGGSSVSANDYSISFGDGRTGTVSIGCGIVAPWSNACPRALTGSHTYTAAGTYTAKLHNNLMACAPADCNVVGTVTITVQ